MTASLAQHGGAHLSSCSSDPLGCLRKASSRNLLLNGYLASLAISCLVALVPLSSLIPPAAWQRRVNAACICQMHRLWRMRAK